MAAIKLTSGCTATISLDSPFEIHHNLEVEKLEHLRLRTEDGEISVFEAQKYFNEGMDKENSPRVRDEEIDISPLKPKVEAGKTPSICSQASWNSESMLLETVLRNPPQRKPTKRQGRSFLASLGCNCYCGDENSIDVDEHVGVLKGETTKKEPMARTSKSQLNPWLVGDVHCTKIDEVGLGLITEDSLRFPILNLDAKQRKSLEVFGERKEKSLAMMEELEIPEKCEGMYSDNGSDASLDLFEIESFKNNSNSFPSCYAPSEVSVEWSVVTASAADFSVVSDSEEPVSTKAQKLAPIIAKRTNGKRRSGILLGCKSEKDVRIAGDHADRTNGKAGSMTHRCQDFWLRLANRH